MKTLTISSFIIFIQNTFDIKEYYIKQLNLFIIFITEDTRTLGRRQTSDFRISV